MGVRSAQPLPLDADLPWMQTRLGCKPPWIQIPQMQTPLDADPPLWMQTLPLRMQTPPSGCWMQTPWMQTIPPSDVLDPPSLDADTPFGCRPTPGCKPRMQTIPPSDVLTPQMQTPLDADPLNRQTGIKTFRKLCLRAVNIYQFIDIFEVIMCSKIHFLNL